MDVIKSRNDDLVTLLGSPGSPYTRKMLAVLRYRRIPYRLLLGAHGDPRVPMAKVPLLPTFYLTRPGGEMEIVTDSTPLIRRFDESYSGRKVVPMDPALAFLDALIEDYADEWLTKAMFHYRWAHDADVYQAERVLPTWSIMGARDPMSDEQLRQTGKAVSERQIPRLRYVGSNPVTASVIESSYTRFLDAFENHLRSHRCLFGRRPGASDFGVFAQLTQLAQIDPTPTALALARAPRVYGWVGAVEDLSGLEPEDADWFDAGALPQTVIAILGEVGRVYVPLLLANAAAVQAGASEVITTIDGKPWTQQPFIYQAKCLSWLRRDYAALGSADKAKVDAALAGTGCEILFHTVS